MCFQYPIINVLGR